MTSIIMKSIVLTFLSFVFLLNARGQDFRKTSWDMPWAKVREVEVAHLKVETLKKLEYKTALGQYKADLIYYFENNKLYLGRYVIDVPKVEDEDLLFGEKEIRAFQLLHESLNNKYGKPAIDTVLMFAEITEDTPDKLREELLKGSLKYVSIWNTAQTKIAIKLAKGNDEPNLSLSYLKQDSIANLYLQEGIRSHSFKNIPWGSGHQEVKNTEKRTIMGLTPSRISYWSNFDGRPCQIDYLFEEKKLYGVDITITPNHFDKNKYITDYKHIIVLLNDVFGSAIQMNESWNNYMYSKSKKQLGTALVSEHVEFSSFWSTYGTEAEVKMYGSKNNGKIELKFRETSIE